MTAPCPTPLARRRLTRAAAEAANRLARRVPPLVLTASGSQLAAAVIGPIPQVEGAPWLRMTIDGHPAAVQIGWGSLRRLAGVPLEGLPAADATLLAEEALAPWLDEIETATGLSLRFQEITAGALPDAQMLPRGWGVQGQGPGRAILRQAGALLLSDAASAALGRAMAALAVPRNDLPGLVLRLQAEIDGAVLRLADLRSLQPGDALMLDDGEGHARLVLEGQHAAPARRDGAAWRLIGPFRPRSPFPPSPVTKGPPMTENTTPPPPAPEAAAPDTPSAADGAGREPVLGTLDDLDIRLSFRLGEALFTLAELKSLTPGAVVTLDRPDGGLVDILANGRRIGTGEVIAVGNQRAVEIRSLFADG